MCVSAETGCIFTLMLASYLSSCLSPNAELANNRLRLYIFLAMLREDFKSGRANVSHHCRSALAL